MYLGPRPSTFIGPAKGTVKGYGQMIHTSNDRSLTPHELAQSDEIKSRVDFDKSIELKLGVRGVPEDIDDDKVEVETPMFER
jgi:hypothetical protein